jgi:uncharacterized protein (TIGR04551 family)
MNSFWIGLVALATAVVVPNAAHAQTADTAEPAAAEDATTAAGYDATAAGDATTATGYDATAAGDATTATGYDTTAAGDVPTEPTGEGPALTPPDDSFFGDGSDTTQVAGDGDTGEPTDTAGDTEPNPAEALLSASREDREDAAAERDAEQVTWQEEASRFIDLKGYFRTRGDLFYQLHLGRPDGVAFAHPYDDGVDQNGAPCSGAAGETCFTNDTIAGANLRLRLEPVIHLSSYVQVYATFDVLDNLVLGSTPEGYANTPGDAGGFQLTARSPWAPLGAFASTQVPPVSGINSFSDSITVKRAWAEVTTPLGRLMFGRMQSQWGLGILANGGNDIDSDYGDLADRIMWAARYMGIVGALGADFAGEGPTSQAIFQSQGQAWDLGQLDDVSQYVAVLGYRPAEEEQLVRLRSGLPAFAGGAYYVFRNQVLSSEGTDWLGNQDNAEHIRRDAWAHIIDLWFQFRYERFRAETEWTVIYGGIMCTETANWDFVERNAEVLQWGGVLQLEYTAIGQPTVRSNRLRFGVEAGYASGDPNEEGLSAAAGILDQRGAALGVAGADTLSRFRFDPDFNVDLILFEQILGSVSGAYYFRPWVDYTLALGVGRSKKFLNFRLDTVWSRASEFMSTRSNLPDLGLEIDASVTFETADNFIARLQYGVFFPFGAFEDLTAMDGSQVRNGVYDLSNAQTVQALLGVTF